MNEFAQIAAPREWEDEAPQTVLVVDDSLGQRKLLSRILSRMGLKVLAAQSGEAALALCQFEQPDLIVSDWMMPGMDGLEFCRTFRHLLGTNYSYFILLTSRDEKQDIALGLDTGADDFLTKPVNADELRARIRAGQRILRMERELRRKNRLIGHTLAEMEELHARIDHDLVEAQKLQQSLVPDRFLRFGNLDVSLLLQPAGRVGGDLVGAFEVNPREIGVFAIDVSGHGIASALMTTRLAAHLSSRRPGQNIAITKDARGAPVMRSPVATVSRLNHMVLNEMETDQYLTIVLARVDLVTGMVTLTQAGHPHPMLQRRDGKVSLVGEGGMPVGLLPDAEFTQTVVELEPGDRLFMGSDGITECLDPAGAMLDDSGLTEWLESQAARHGADLFTGLLDRLQSFCGTAETEDDVSAVVIELRPEDAAAATG